MRHYWLTYLSIVFLTGLTFFFYWLFVRPIPAPLPPSLAEPGSISEPTITFQNPTLGPADARVTIVEYGDFLCEACTDVTNGVAAVLRAYPTDVRFVWKHAPNEGAHEGATKASVAAQCAFEQDDFWGFYDQLFTKQAFQNESTYLQIAQDLKLNTAAFESCVQTNDTLPLVQKDLSEAIGLGIKATPTIYINNQEYTGALTEAALMQYVETLLRAQ